MKVYFLERQFLSPALESIYHDILGKAGLEVDFRAWTSNQEVMDGAKDAAAVLSMAIAMNAETIAALPALKFIGRCGIGYDSVDLKAATERGAVVCNVPDYCVHEVAAQALTLMMAVARQLPAFMRRAREGGFGPGQGAPVYRLEGRTLGLLGYGRTGRQLAKMGLGMGMKVAVYDPFVSDAGNPDVKLVSFDELIAGSDIISLHMPLTAETKYILSRPQFEKMKKTAIVVNTSRGGLINTGDLVWALKENRIKGAGLDVFEAEPLPPSHELFTLGNAVLTPHVALYSEESLVDMHTKLAGQLVDVLEGRRTKNIVNPDVLDKLQLQ
ncbi:MAG: C-terminal binding protein [Candidatus Adiutrix sp.]|nr:C-terminal binding protein [Candidatus Adiutrix sp.]